MAAGVSGYQMIRRVAYLKAILGGAAGAAAWELVVRLLILAGLPMMDLVFVLGTMFLGEAPWWQWWPLGMALHAMVGAIWAIFYAYFIWSEFDWRPVTQGAAFAVVIPALLAGLIMVPQMGYMHPLVLNGPMPRPGLFGWNAKQWGGPGTDFLGHLIYGLTLGLIYRRPVGYKPGRGPRPHASRHVGPPHPRTGAAPRQEGSSAMTKFMFATGIECSYPTLDNGKYRMDELEATDHYRYWRRDLELVREIGLTYLRYGPPLHRTFVGPGKYDWDFTDDVCNAMQELGIVPIMDLCHFGLPDWLGNFQNEAFPDHFAEYAKAFAQRYPWVRLYTPVNEMYVTAKMSALDGVWNEQLKDEGAYCRATCHLARACILAIQAIEKERPDAIFINSESSEFFQPCCPDPKIQRIADFENQRRFIALDLLFGRPLRGDVMTHLLDNGIPRQQYEWFLQQDASRRIVLGVDYYEWNEKLINSDGKAQTLGELFGWYVITQQYYDRYKRPVMHTETNVQDAQKAPGWLWRQWHNVQLMRHAGVPVLGFTWYSLTDQVDWNVGMSKAEGNVNPVGLFDLNRNPRPAAQAYKQLLDLYGDEPLLPATDVLQLN